MTLDNAQLPIVGNAPVGHATLSKTDRHDLWWVQPLLTFIVFSAFIVYATWRTFENNFYGDPDVLAYSWHYLSPFYSPTLGADLRIGGYSITPALWILPFPLLFRGTCYYYRKAYYRAFFWDPPACAVGEIAPRKNYTGERAFPFVLQNLHRYAFYFAAIIMVILWYDAFDAFRYTDIANKNHFFIGMGSIIFLVNVILLSLYTFSCHSWRHLLGGAVDCFSCTSGTKTRHGMWEHVTHLNENHALWAWLSLFSVALTDLYVRCVATGAITDIHFWPRP